MEVGRWLYEVHVVSVHLYLDAALVELESAFLSVDTKSERNSHRVQASCVATTFSASAPKSSIFPGQRARVALQARF